MIPVFIRIKERNQTHNFLDESQFEMCAKLFSGFSSQNCCLRLIFTEVQIREFPKLQLESWHTMSLINSNNDIKKNTRKKELDGVIKDNLLGSVREVRCTDNVVFSGATSTG